MENTIIFVGPTGVGKSFLGTGFLKMANSYEKFKTSNSHFSCSKNLAQACLVYEGKNYTLLDCPGFFDVSDDGSDDEQNESGITAVQSQQQDKINFCRLVQAIGACSSISAILFVYTGRFSGPWKLWYDRILEVVSKVYQGYIILIHNKVQRLNLEEQIRNEEQLRSLLNVHKISYFPVRTFRRNGEEAKLSEDISDLMKIISVRVPFKLGCNLKIPELCYEKIVKGESFTEDISFTENNDGKLVFTTKDGTYETTKNGWKCSALGIKKGFKQVVPKTIEESKLVNHFVTYQTKVEYRKIYKVRFDGSQDFIENKELRRWTEKTEDGVTTIFSDLIQTVA